MRKCATKVGSYYDTYSVFFKLNTDTDTSVFENHTGYWILVFSFCTGQVSDLT